MFGNLAPNIFRKCSVVDMFMDMYYKYPNEKFIGVFDLLKPVYLIRDPDVLKQITVKDFNHFINHRPQINEDIEPLVGRSLFVLKNQKWKDMRFILTSAFTGSKMRQMFSLMHECCKNSVNHLMKSIIIVDKPVTINMKDFFTRFTSDSIASCAFGITTNSFEEKNNEFYKMGISITELKNIQIIKFLCYSSFPKIMKFLKVQLFEKSVVNYFRNLIKDIIEHKKNNNIQRPDMINLLVQAQQQAHNDDEINFEVKNLNKSIRQWKDDDLTAQCLLFFFAGYHSANILMSFMSLELAFNPDIQNKLIQEIDGVNAELNGEPVTYEILQKMKYLDMIVCESLRRWPPLTVIDRICNKKILIKNNNNNYVEFNPGDAIWIPIYSIHNDPKNFPNPNKFDPERFSDENKSKIKPFSYLPFGMGPRNCIGVRFALMEIKAIFFEILTQMTFEMSPKCQYPVKLAKNILHTLPENGVWLQCRKRQ